MTLDVHIPRAALSTVAEPRPVFVVGAARSGTSLVYKTLALHDDLAWTNNYVQRWPGLGSLSLLNRVARALPERRHRVWFGEDGGNAYVYGSKRALLDRAFPMPTEAETLFERLGVPPTWPAGQPATMFQRRAMRDAFAQIRRTAGGSAVLSKRIAHNERISLLVDIFPQARFVEVVRDGRPVAASLRRVDWWEDSRPVWLETTPGEAEAAGADPWHLAARNWVEDVRAVAAGRPFVPDDQWRTVRYDQLVADPTGTFDGLLDFLEVDAGSHWRRDLDAMSFPHRADGWRDKMDPAVQEQVTAVQADDLVRLGFAL